MIEDYQIAPSGVKKNVTIRVDRLLKLAEHLESGKLGHRRWEMGSYNGYNALHNDDGWRKDSRGWRVHPELVDIREGYDKDGLGVEGNAIGEFPIVFPEDWHFQYCGHVYKAIYFPSLKGKNEDEYPRVHEDVSEYLGIGYDLIFHLFCVGLQECERYGGKELEDDSTAKDISYNIREFINKIIPKCTVIYTSGSLS
jgi:hypothetical protein